MSGASILLVVTRRADIVDVGVGETLWNTTDSVLRVGALEQARARGVDMKTLIHGRRAPRLPRHHERLVQTAQLSALESAVRDLARRSVDHMASSATHATSRPTWRCTIRCASS
jgi:hypothetical protein